MILMLMGILLFCYGSSVFGVDNLPTLLGGALLWGLGYYMEKGGTK